MVISCNFHVLYIVDILEGGIFHPMVFFEYYMQILAIYLYIFRCIWHNDTVLE